MKYIGYDETQKAVRLFNDWALMLTEAGRPLEAEKLYHRAIELSSTRQNERTVSPTLLHNYAGVLRDLARVTEAAHFAELAQSGASTAGDEFLHCQASLQRARIFRDQHDFVRASAIVAQEEAKLRKQLPPGHYAFASLASDKSLLLQATGNLSMALQFATEAIDIDEASIQVGGQGAAYLPLLLIRRSGVELDLHAAADAEADASRALRLQQGALEAGTESSQMGRAYLAHARALAQLGRSAEASAEFRLAAEHLNATLGPNHPDTVAAHRLAELPSKKKL
jgi:tetratricopeptide (TPR) repeat protein